MITQATQDTQCGHWLTIIAEWAKSAKRRGKSWDVPAAYLIRLFSEGVCRLSGLPISPGSHSKDYRGRTVSADRIDSGKDYVYGNVQPVHKRCNVAKQNLPDELFVELCRTIVRHWDKTHEPVNLTPAELADKLAEHPMI